MSLLNLKKIRVQLFDSEMNQITDRLVTQETEFRTGPKEPHKGPLKIEVCLFTKDDANDCLTYIKKLIGDLPIEVAPAKLKTANMASADDDSWRESLVQSVPEFESQDGLIKDLRNQGFVFLTAEHLADMGLVTWTEDDVQWSYQWMVKLIKEAKSLINNKYDPTVMFGFKLLGDKVEQMYTYLHGDMESIEMPWKSANKVTFRKTEMVKFPHYMIAEEREKFRVELYKARKLFSEEKPHKFSKFFRRWYTDVDFREKEEWTPKIENPQ